jgi:hypothetical protein
MAFTPQSFLSNIKAKDGLAKNNRFEVILPIPQYVNDFVKSSALEKLLNLPTTIVTDVSDAINQILGNESADGQSKTSNASMSRYLALQCESAELPGRELITTDVKIYGPTFKVPYQTQYNQLALNFVCTNEFYERKLFDRWLDAIMPSDTNNLRFPKGGNTGTGYMTNIKVIQYDDFIKQIYAVEMIDAYPISIAAQPLSWSEEGFHRLTVQFAYQKYRVVYSGQYDIAAAAAQLFGDKASKFFDKAGNSISENLITPVSRLIF